MSDQITTLLKEYTVLINTFGAESRQARDYFEKHRCNTEFAELGELAVRIKTALKQPEIENDLEHECGCPR